MRNPRVLKGPLLLLLFSTTRIDSPDTQAQETGLLLLFNTTRKLSAPSPETGPDSVRRRDPPRPKRRMRAPHLRLAHCSLARVSRQIARPAVAVRRSQHKSSCLQCMTCNRQHGISNNLHSTPHWPTGHGRGFRGLTPHGEVSIPMTMARLYALHLCAASHYTIPCNHSASCAWHVFWLLSIPQQLC